ncbi:MAG: DUF1989 domain-containing protein [Rhizobiaceae bacterium]
MQTTSQNALEARRYFGLKTPNRLRLDVCWGEAGGLEVPAHSIVSITNLDGGGPCLVTCLADNSKNFSTDFLEVNGGKAVGIDASLFDCRSLQAIADTRGARLADGRALSVFDPQCGADEKFLFKTNEKVMLFVISPVSAEFLASGGGGRYRIHVQEDGARPGAMWLPAPLGKVRDEWTVKRGTARAYEIKKGQFVQILDVEGQQCSDFMAMRSSALDAGLERNIDSTVSRTMARSAYPLPGLHDKFFDQDMRPLLAVRQDTVGRHDTYALACTARGYEERGFPGHLNCSDNISDAFQPFGVQRRKAWPAINFFFNSWIDGANNSIASDEAWSRPGDYVAMEALTDLVCVSTACPDDVDPINGWNPTDIHVRIYEEDTSITHSVVWRGQPEDEGRLTQHSAFHSRTSKLTSSYAPARDLWLASQYDGTGAIEEYWACRESATLQDMSSLLKYDIVGPDAEQLLQVCLTRDVAKLSQHRGFYALLCDERGSVIDDGTLFRLEPAAFRWCCGSENSAVHLQEKAKELGLSVRVLSLGQRLSNLALQGPRSRDILRKVVFTQPNRPSLDNLKWFGFTIGRLYDRDGPVFMLCRSGFTGELGYEVFCDRNDAEEIWDGLMDAGAPHGLVPMGGMALDIMRIEAGLMAAGAEFGPDVDAMESGLGFAVDFKKDSFMGKSALERNAAAPRRKLVGLLFAGNEAPSHGDGVFVGREQVGVITSACTSPQLGHAIAMARIAIENCADGAELEVGRLDGKMKRYPCRITSLPFIDPTREKPRA